MSSFFILFLHDNNSSEISRYLYYMYYLYKQTSLFPRKQII